MGSSLHSIQHKTPGGDKHRPYILDEEVLVAKALFAPFGRPDAENPLTVFWAYYHMALDGHEVVEQKREWKALLRRVSLFLLSIAAMVLGVLGAMYETQIASIGIHEAVVRQIAVMITALGLGGGCVTIYFIIKSIPDVIRHLTSGSRVRSKKEEKMLADTMLKTGWHVMEQRRIFDGLVLVTNLHQQAFMRMDAEATDRLYRALRQVKFELTDEMDYVWQMSQNYRASDGSVELNALRWDYPDVYQRLASMQDLTYEDYEKRVKLIQRLEGLSSLHPDDLTRLLVERCQKSSEEA